MTSHIGTGARISPHALIGNPAELMPGRRASLDWQTDYNDLFPLVRPDALIEAFVTVDSGTYHPTQIGERSYLMKGVHVGHDAVIGDDCTIAPHASIGGSVWIGNSVYLGMCSTVKPFCSIGEHSTLGQGAAAICHIPPFQVWGGVPARLLYRICADCHTRLAVFAPRFGSYEPKTPPSAWAKRLHSAIPYENTVAICDTCYRKRGER